MYIKEAETMIGTTSRVRNHHAVVDRRSGGVAVVFSIYPHGLAGRSAAEKAVLSPQKGTPQQVRFLRGRELYFQKGSSIHKLHGVNDNLLHR